MSEPDAVELRSRLDRLGADQLRELVLGIAEGSTYLTAVVTANLREFDDDGAPPAIDDVTRFAVQIEQEIPTSLDGLEWWERREVGEEVVDLAYAVYSHVSEASGAVEPRMLRVVESGVERLLQALASSADAREEEVLDVALGTFLDAHATAARARDGALPDSEQVRLAQWLAHVGGLGVVARRPDPAAYSGVLDGVGVARLRELVVEGGSGDDGGWAAWAAMRLAVLDGDERGIRAWHGDPSEVREAVALATALQEAGLIEAAAEVARDGRGLPGQWGHDDLVEIEVADALRRGAEDEALAARWSWFQEQPAVHRLLAVREVAERTGAWAGMAGDAESRLRARDGGGYLQYLVDSGRAEQLWEFAQEQPEAVASRRLWRQVCRMRGRSHPADVLPVYRELVEDLLSVSDVHRYRSASELLTDMRTASEAVGEAEVVRFSAYVGEIKAGNRRRPRLLATLAEAGLG